MKVEQTKLPGVLLIKPEIFRDHRGEYVETYAERDYKKAGINVDFVQHDISTSRQGVLRGIHGDSMTAKLIDCLHGEIFLAVVDWRENSPNYKQFVTFTLNDENHHQVYIPSGFGNGHYVMSEKCIFHYLQSTYYGDCKQFTIKWDSLGIEWPLPKQKYWDISMPHYYPPKEEIVQPILSERDKCN